MQSSDINDNAIPSRRRLRLFQVVCASLFTSSLGFVQTAPPQRYALHPAVLARSRPSTSPISPALQRDPRTATFSTSPASGATATATAGSSGGDSKKVPLLTPDEERELLRRAVEYRRLSALERDLAMQHPAKQLPLLSVRARMAGYGDELDAYEDAKYKGQKAREQLVTRNMGLVHYCVTSIIGRDVGGGKDGDSNRNPRKTTYSRVPLNFLSREDLIQEGAIGLARAVDKWNPEIGGRFSTYAVYWVRAAILRCIAERDDMLRVPSHVTQAVQKINKAARRLGWELDTSGMISLGAGNPASNPRNSVSWKEAETAKKLALEAGLSDRTYQEAMKVRSRRYSGGYVPFEQWMQKGRNMVSDVVASSALVGPDESTSEGMSADDSEELRSVLSKFLRPKEMEALSWRYGLLKDDPVVDNESAVERANRQFCEMEDQLFGATSAATIAVAASSLPPTASTAAASTAATAPAASDIMGSGPAKGRFGEAMTFTEVGKKMEVSAEYTRKLCHQALDKLRLAAQDGRLEPALLL
jgi:RNA polymerase sigma factor (sigma-70 family)